MTEKEENMKVNFKTFENEHIKVFWNPRACTHAGMCVRGNGKVFEVGRRPWIDLSQASADEIRSSSSRAIAAAIIDRCPSKALQYEIKKNN